MTAKSYDEKRDAFQRMLAGRLPKAVKAVELLANLSRGSDYAWTNAELQSMTDQLDDAVDTVLNAFGVEPHLPDQQENGSSLPEQVIKGGVDRVDAGAAGDQVVPPTGAHGVQHLTRDVRSEVKWSYDALRRGDKKLAEDRLRRAVEAILAGENNAG